MVAGIIILAVLTAALSLIPLTHIIVWSIAFVVLRIGAAMAEISTESYFFKQVNETDSTLISMFRMLPALGILCGSLIVLAIVPITGLTYLFAFLGMLLFVGVPTTLRIRDSR